jgi:hypothetical protein
MESTDFASPPAVRTTEFPLRASSLVGSPAPAPAPRFGLGHKHCPLTQPQTQPKRAGPALVTISPRPAAASAAACDACHGECESDEDDAARLDCVECGVSVHPACYGARPKLALINLAH